MSPKLLSKCSTNMALLEMSFSKISPTELANEPVSDAICDAYAPAAALKSATDIALGVAIWTFPFRGD